MDKFGLFNAFTKIASQKNIEKPLTDILTNLLNNTLLDNSKTVKQPKNQQKPTKTDNKTIKNKYSQEYIVSVMKKHDELSKKIDENIKNS